MAIDAEGKPIEEHAYRCQIHADRVYHPAFGYASRQTGPSSALPRGLAALCDDCPSPRYMFIASAKSPADLTLQCTACGHEQPFSL
jgi:hypothetical protein